MRSRTPAEWRNLAAALDAIAHDRTASDDRKAEARRILSMIPREMKDSAIREGAFDLDSII